MESHKDCVHRLDYDALMQNMRRAMQANGDLVKEIQRLNEQVNTLTLLLKADETA
jgi:hypothetical protein